MFAISVLVIVLSNKSLFDIAKQDPQVFNDESRGAVDEANVLYLPLIKWR